MSFGYSPMSLGKGGLFVIGCQAYLLFDPVKLTIQPCTPLYL